MNNLNQKQIRQQFVLQMQLYNRLKKWLRNAMVLSSFLISLALFLPSIPLVFWPACIGLSFAFLAMILIGLALKRGQDNLEKLLILLDQKA
ncbi:hypothetical protein IM774_03345 [Erysipelotrichaceae bacterium RD49]|nr:hypothetical protein [Erysipelotrichaceae bacterium RD49]